jgi:hypothetical protein
MESGMAVQHDMTPHIATWNLFIKYMFYGGASIVVLLVLLAFFFV